MNFKKYIKRFFVCARSLVFSRKQSRGKHQPFSQIRKIYRLSRADKRRRIIPRHKNWKRFQDKSKSVIQMSDMRIILDDDFSRVDWRFSSKARPNNPRIRALLDRVTKTVDN